jgi:hypothetical protein
MRKFPRLKLVHVLIAGLFCVLAAWAGDQHFFARKPLDLADLSRYSVEELIDGLQDEASEGLGTHSTAWADGFLASDEEPTFRGGVLGSTRPSVSPVMRELVRRGVAALPDLMNHLEDRRPTRLIIKLPFGPCGGMWFSDEYESRYADEDKQPPGVNEDRGGNRHVQNGEYAIRVGDLCYVTIGQIVNRRLNVVRYQPSACVVINSPAATPSLAAAVRKEWGGLTAEDHEQSLVRDSEASSEYAFAAALARLRLYYPDAAARIAARGRKQ